MSFAICCLVCSRITNFHSNCVSFAITGWLRRSSLNSGATKTWLPLTLSYAGVFGLSIPKEILLPMIESWLASIVLECTKSSAIDWAKEAPASLVIFIVDSRLTCIGAVAWICGGIVHRILLCVWTFQNTTLYGNHLLRTVLRPIFAAHHRPVIVSPNNLARRSLCINLEIIHGFFLNCPPNSPGGYSQWQSQTVARRQGKCRALANNYLCKRPRGDAHFRGHVSPIFCKGSPFFQPHPPPNLML